jgi:Nitrile hydratase beta subunit
MVEKLTYYERWIVAAANCLLQKGILTPDEIGRKTREVAERFEAPL